MNIEQKQIQNEFSICICTYNRTALLNNLLLDISTQTIQPQKVVIVDGNPISNEVIKLCRNFTKIPITYIPSNHSNIAYQRYLSWRIEHNSPLMIYFDDDIRIFQKDAISKLLSPFHWNSKDIVGTTGTLRYPDTVRSELSILKDRNYEDDLIRNITSFFGSSKNYPLGEITPCGVKVRPKEYTNEYGIMRWLFGAVMAFSNRFLNEDCFSKEMFALFEVGLGMGEDTLMAYLASRSGKMVLVKNAEFHHPSIDNPKAYSINPKRLGYTTAYSRRLLNDYIITSPIIRGRIDLLKYYFGNIIFNWYKTFKIGNQYSEYSKGFMLGALRGLLVKPKAKLITPNIDWIHDAEIALSKRIEFH